MTLLDIDPQLPAVGTRINYLSNLGTVRFVGEVQGTKGVWLGVEWDDPRRGKHSGTKDGKQYFTCTVPNSASFLRPSASVNRGQSFLDALLSKYVEAPLDATTEKVVLGSSNGVIAVEAVGMDKVRSKLSNLERLREVSVDMLNVAYADAPGEVRDKCPNLKGLDLSRNLVTSWETVGMIASELPLLETLSLNFNRLRHFSQRHVRTLFPSVQDLRLNGTLTTWGTMITLLPSFPELLHLEMGLNRLRALTVPVKSPISTKLTSLNLEANELESWQNIMVSVAIFSRLDRIILSSNMIANIFPPCLPRVKLPQIKHLILISNNIQSWQDINALCEWFPQLQTLNTNMNPIDREPSSRPLIIARYPNLVALNSSTVSEAERRDSEVFYLSFIVKDGIRSEADREQRFPRYLELSEKYGKPEEHKEMQAGTLGSRLIEVHFFRLLSPSQSAHNIDLSSKPEFTLRILPSMALRLLCSKVLKQMKVTSPHANIKMWLVLERETMAELVELDMQLTNKVIEWWGVENDCKIVFYI